MHVRSYVSIRCTVDVFVYRELGTVPPQADLKQEAIVLMQRRRIDVLKQKLDQIEQEKSSSLAAGVYCVCAVFLLCYVNCLPCPALDKQKQKLDELAEEKIKLRLQRQLLQLDQDYARKV